MTTIGGMAAVEPYMNTLQRRKPPNGSMSWTAWPLSHASKEAAAVGPNLHCSAHHRCLVAQTVAGGEHSWQLFDRRIEQRDVIGDESAPVSPGRDCTPRGVSPVASAKQ